MRRGGKERERGVGVRRSSRSEEERERGRKGGRSEEGR